MEPQRARRGGSCETCGGRTIKCEYDMCRKETIRGKFYFENHVEKCMTVICAGPCNLTPELVSRCQRHDGEPVWRLCPFHMREVTLDFVHDLQKDEYLNELVEVHERFSPPRAEQDAEPEMVVTSSITMVNCNK